MSRFQPWYVAYALLGLVQSGAAPILLPLSARHGLDAGLTYGAFALAGLAAPVLGGWGDRRQRHRTLLIGGLGLATLGIALFPWAHGLAARMALAATAGLGVIAASTVGTMFIVETTPQAEWDERIGALQAWLSGGQIAGLAMAGTLASRPVVAFETAAGALLLGALVAWGYAPGPGVPVARGTVPTTPIRGGEAGVARHHFQHVSLNGLRALLRLRSGPLPRFLGIWVLSLAATSAVSVMLPVAITHDYGTTALVPAGAYAVGIALSLPLYSVSGRWEARTSAWHVMLAAFGGRSVLLAAMAVFGFLHGSWTMWAILVAFAMTQVIWPLLAVGANTLAVTLNPARRGEGVGLLNASNSLASTIGGVLGGLIVQEAGYATLCLVACLAVTLAGAIIARDNPVPGKIAG